MEYKVKQRQYSALITALFLLSTVLDTIIEEDKIVDEFLVDKLNLRRLRQDIEQYWDRANDLSRK